MASVNQRTRRSGLKSTWKGMSLGAWNPLPSAAVAQMARPKPSAPPRRPRMVLSISNCRSNWRRDFLPARCGTSKKQIGYVGAGNQQDQSHHDEKGTCGQGRASCSIRLRSGLELRHGDGIEARISNRVIAFEPATDSGDRRAALVVGDTGTQASHEAE